MEIKIKVKGTELMEIDRFFNFQGNLKKLSDEAKEKLKNSILRNGFNAPIFVWKGKKYILDGHQRITAVKELLSEGHTLEGDKLPFIEIEADNKKQAAEMVLSYNSQYGEITDKGLETFLIDFDLDIKELGEIVNLDIDLSKIDFDLNASDDSSGSLKRDYIMPPFSVLDTRQGDWQDRKREWYKIISTPEATREETLADKSENSRFIGTASLFDPVLAEILFKWFCPKNGKILNLFSGGVEPNIVAGNQDYNLTGIELRQEQIDHTNKNLQKLGLDNVELICDDIMNMNNHLKEKYDLLFSCPPYYDLEQYCDDPRDASNMEDEEFEKVIKYSIIEGVKKLKDNRFAIYVISEVRGKEGYFRKFVPKVINWFEEAGARYYNEIILVNAIGSLPLRIRKMFESYRKVGRMHQNVLVFYKGDTKKIKELFGGN